MFLVERLRAVAVTVVGINSVRTSMRCLVAASSLAWIALVGCPSSSFAQLPPAPPTPNATSICDMPQARGTAIYNKYCVSQAAAPVGPSPEELRKRREAKDTQEAVDDAEDKGEEFYKKSDWANAAKSFQEALDYDPDDTVASANLQKAQANLRGEAARQAVNARTRSIGAAGLGGEPSSMEARKPFDDADATKNNGIAVPAGSGDSGHKDPVVPPSRRTAAITKFEQQRTEDRKQRMVLQEKLKALDPQKDPVAVSAIKQQQSKLNDHINYLNFSIDDQLKAPSTVPPATTK